MIRGLAAIMVIPSLMGSALIFHDIAGSEGNPIRWTLALAYALLAIAAGAYLTGYALTGETP